MATTNSLKKKQQQLRADQDLLADRWTEVLAAEEHELERLLLSPVPESSFLLWRDLERRR